MFGMERIVTRYMAATTTMAPSTRKKPHGRPRCGPSSVLLFPRSLFTGSSLPSIEADLSTAGSGVLCCSAAVRSSSRSKSLILVSVPLLFVMAVWLPPGSLALSGVSADEPEDLPAELLEICVPEILARVPFYGLRPVRFVVPATPACFPLPGDFLLRVVLVFLRLLFATLGALLSFPAVFLLLSLVRRRCGERRLPRGGLLHLLEEPLTDALFGLLVGEVGGPAAGTGEILAGKVVVVGLRAHGPVGEFPEVAAGVEGPLAHDPKLPVAQGLVAHLPREGVDVFTAIGDGDADPGPADLHGEGEGEHIVGLCVGGEVDVREAVAVEPVALETAVRNARPARQDALRHIVEVKPFEPVVRRSAGSARVDDRRYCPELAPVGVRVEVVPRPEPRCSFGRELWSFQQVRVGHQVLPEDLGEVGVSVPPGVHEEAPAVVAPLVAKV